VTHLNLQNLFSTATLLPSLNPAFLIRRTYVPSSVLCLSSVRLLPTGLIQFAFMYQEGGDRDD